MLGARDAAAFEVKHTREGAGVHWDKGEVRFTLHPSMAELPEGARAAQGAFASWSGREGAPSIVVEDADAPAAPGLDGKNAVFYMKDGWAPAGRALAITVLTYDAKTGAIVDADVVVNGAYTFAVLPETARPGPAPATAHADLSPTTPSSLGARYDLVHVLAHESGHALGLDDETDRSGSLMYRYSAPGDASVRAPTDDDLHGLSVIYGEPVDAGGGGGGCQGRVSPRGPGGDGARVAIALGAAGAALVLLRKRRGRGAVAACVFGVGLLAPSPSDPEAHAASLDEALTGRVVETRSFVEGGLFRTELEVETASGARVKATQWGGEIGGLRQEIDHAPLARVGARVAVAWDGETRAVRLLRL